MTREQYLTLAQAAYDGGFTVDLAGYHPESGFAVAVPGHEQHGYLKPGRTTLDGIAGYIEGYVVQHGAALHKPARYLGAWRDGNDLVLDVVQVIPDKATAVLLGRLRGQDAIYHLDTGKTITLNCLHCGASPMEDQYGPSSSWCECSQVVAPKQRVADDDNGRGDDLNSWEDDGGS